jgi:hypothetical protein
VSIVVINPYWQQLNTRHLHRLRHAPESEQRRADFAKAMALSHFSERQGPRGQHSGALTISHLRYWRQT